MILDVVLVIIGILIVLIAAQNGLLRSLLMVFVVWVISIIVGLTMLGFEAADQLAQSIGDMLGGYPNNTLYEAIVFFLLFISLNIAAIFFASTAFDDNALHKLGIFNTILAAVVGLALALVIMSVICTAWGVMAESYWQPTKLWQMMHYNYQTSLLRPFLNQVLVVFRAMMFPFVFSRYPKFYGLPTY